MEKLIYLLGDAEAGIVPQGRADLRDALLGVASSLVAAGAHDLSFTVADVDDPDIQGIAQFNNMGLFDAQLSLWVDHLDGRAAIESIVSGLADRVAGYLVTESILRDYAARDWKTGDVELFYGGRENRKRIVNDLLSFVELETLSTFVMREYILEV